MKKKIAILVTNGFEESELKSPKEHLELQGWTTHIISPEEGTVKSWINENWGPDYPVDFTLDNVTAKEYDALLLPGGVINPDSIRTNEKALKFIRGFFFDKKPVAAICHGPQSLINAQVVKDREMTSYPSIKKDLMNAGAIWLDRDVVVDQGLITSRSPEDLQAFNKKIVEELKKEVSMRV